MNKVDSSMSKLSGRFRNQVIDFANILKLSNLEEESEQLLKQLEEITVGCDSVGITMELALVNKLALSCHGISEKHPEIPSLSLAFEKSKLPC